MTGEFKRVRRKNHWCLTENCENLLGIARKSRFCSELCQENEMKRRDILPCDFSEECNKKRAKGRSFCYKHIEIRKKNGSIVSTRVSGEFACLNCSTINYNLKYCNRQCEFDYRNPNSKKEKTFWTCEICKFEMNSDDYWVLRKVCSTECSSIKSKLNFYNVSIAEYNQHIEKYGKVCRICGTDKDVVFDHCHDKNIFRGFLCALHNSGLGFFDDNPEYLINAAMYINSFQTDWIASLGEINSQ